MKLYEIEQEIELALEKYYECFNEDWELITTDEEFNLAKKELTEFQNKKSEFMDWILKSRANRLSDIAWINEEIKRLSEMRDRIQRKVNQSENFIEMIVKPNYQWKTINYWLFSVWFRKSTQTIIDNEEIIPTEFKKEKMTICIDKAEIKKSIQKWKEVPGARLQDNLNLNIK